MRILITNPPTNMGDISFVRAGARWPAMKTKAGVKSSQSRYAPFPFFLAYTSAFLKGDGHETFVIDAPALEMEDETFNQELKKRAPLNLAIVETSTPTIGIDLKHAAKIKELTGAKICLVGPHASVFPEQLLKENPFIDFIAMQEYEMTVKELAGCMASGQRYSMVSGLAFRAGNTIHVNEKRPLIEPLDQLPFPDRDSFPIDDAPDMSVYWDGFCERKPALQMVATRGCPFNCNYCLWTQVLYPGRHYRMFSAKRVVDEMELLASKYGAKEIYFDDDTFTGNRQHVVDICNEIIGRKMNISWSCMGDAIIPDRELLALMKKAGCKGMKFGIETACPEVWKCIGKPLTREKLFDFAKWTHELGFKTHGTVCFGLTGDTKETMEETLRFVSRLDVDTVQFSIAIPYPGTRFYDEAVKKGWLIGKAWWEHDGRGLVNYPDLKADEIEKIFNRATYEFNRSHIKKPKWVLRRGVRALSVNGPSGLFYLIRRGSKYIG
ncbi:MAG: radical SAM protein [Candidatus Aenigmatarchaeota archaeon]